MPFGLCNAPPTFERLMETVLSGLQWKSCLIYLDDVVIFARTEEELLERMDDVFHRLGDANLKLKPRKCCLFARKTDYLGHIISQDGVQVSPVKVSAVKEWPTPINVTDVRSFLGTASYYRRFIKDFASIASPLYQLTEKHTRFYWTEECQSAFDILKEALCNAPTLVFPIADGQLVLDTDASLTGLGAVLSQIIDGVERVLGYASRSLSKAERNYCVTRRELLAVVWSLKHFRPYLYGRQFKVRTDHSSLRWLRNFKEPEGQLARWLQVIDEYHFEIIHRAGKLHGNADGLSRQCRQCGRVDNESTLREQNEQAKPESLARAITLEPEWKSVQLANWQQEDTDINPILTAMKSGLKPSEAVINSWSAASKRYYREWDRLRLKDDVLYRAWFDTKGNEISQQLIAPLAIRNVILTTAHDNLLSGHFGDKRTLARVRENFYWFGLPVDVRQWCKTCEICAGRKQPPKRPHHALIQDPVGEPLQRIAVDILGPLDPPTAMGNRYILVLVDYLTKWSEAFPLENQTSETVAKVIVEQFCCRFGIPSQLHSDQGRQFEAQLFKEMCDLLGIRKSRTTALHPQSDGQTERMNRTLLDLLAKLAKDNPKEWDRKLQYAMAAYRSSVHSTTGETPNRLMLGREVATPTSLLTIPPPGKTERLPWVESLHAVFEETYATVVEATKSAQRFQKSSHDRKQKDYQFLPGDFVHLYAPKPHKGVSPKLDSQRWLGPFIVEKKLSEATYLVKKQGAKSGKVVNVDRLAPYSSRDQQRFPVLETEVNENSIREEGSTTGEDIRDADVNVAENSSETILKRDDDLTNLIPQNFERGSLTQPAKRPLRYSRRPARLADYVLNEEDVDK